MNLELFLPTGIVSGIGLLIITLQIRLGNRMTKVETKIDERFKSYAYDLGNIKKDLSEIDNTREDVKYKSQKAIDSTKRAHDRIDEFRDSFIRIENKITEQREEMIKLSSKIENMIKKNGG